MGTECSCCADEGWEEWDRPQKYPEVDYLIPTDDPNAFQIDAVKGRRWLEVYAQQTYGLPWSEVAPHLSVFHSARALSWLVGDEQ